MTPMTPPTAFSERPLQGMTMTAGLLLSLLCAPLANAQGPPINTETAIITGLEGAAVRSFVRVMRKSNADQDLSVVSVPVMIPYELKTNRFLVVASIPYLDKVLEMKGTSQRLSTSGLGDLRLLGVANIFQRDALQETTRMKLVVGLKLPTGRHDAPGIPRPLQSGSGSTDAVVGWVGTWVKGRIGLNADLFYTVTTERDEFEFGDALKYDLALGYRLLPAVYDVYPSPQWNLYLELNGVHTEQSKDEGDSLHDSGGHTLFLSPGIQFIPGRTFLLEVSTQFPIVEDLNGTQPETDVLFSIGFRWLIS